MTTLRRRSKVTDTGAWGPLSNILDNTKPPFVVPMPVVRSDSYHVQWSV